MEPDGLPARRHANFENAWTTAKAALRATQFAMAFKTLRLMHADRVVPFKKLAFVCKLGEGAFGAVEKWRLDNSDDPPTYFAIKRLKNHDVSRQVDDGNDALLEYLDIMNHTGVASIGSGADHDGGATMPARAAQLLANMSENDVLFIKEISVMQHISHPYIINYLGCGVIEPSSHAAQPGGKYLCVAQECCEGGNLEDIIARTARVVRCRYYSYSDALRWATQIAKALDYLHTAHPKVLHRDLKAENVLLDRCGPSADVRVMDFGLMRICKLANPSDEREAYQMTGATGSYLYMAPEVYRGEDYDEKVDIFSLAVIMYELFTMCPISVQISVTGTENEFVAHAAGVSHGYRLRLKQTWPQALSDLISKCWCQDAASRPAAHAVVLALQGLEADVQHMDDISGRPVVHHSKAHRGNCCAM